MDVENTLQEMASCDFSKPLNITIMCDDDEDQYIKSENISDCPTPKIYMETEVENEEISNTSRGESRPTVLRISKEKIVNNEDSDNYIRKKSSKKKKKKSKLHKIRKTEDSSNHKISCTSGNTDKEIDHAPRINNPHDHKVENNNDNLNKVEMKDTTTASLISKENNKDSNNYIEDLLSKVSESLLYILEAYFKHINNVRLYNGHDYRLQESKRRFKYIKDHYFQLSYCTTNVIILSRENDSKFTDCFLESTIKLAEQKNMKISVQQVQPLYYELISWAKLMNKMRTLPRNPVIFNNDNSELRKYLSQPPVLSANTIVPNSSQRAKVSIHNSNTPRPEIRISLEPDSQTNNIIQNRNLEYGLQNHNNGNTQPGFPQVDQRYANFQLLRSNNYHVGYNLTNDIRHFYGPRVPEVKDCVADQNRCTVPNGYCHNPSNLNFTNAMNTRLLPTYEEVNVWKNVSTNQNGYADISKQHENVNTFSNMDNIRSPDSGFISPHQLNSPTENMVVQNVHSTIVTPLITHVTSLNPNATQIAEGPCHVCSTRTKQKCLGCYKTYYCSYQCQKQDWNQHMSICKLRPPSQQATNIFY